MDEKLKKLIAKSFEVIRGKLEGTAMPTPQPARLDAELVWTRISRLARFWNIPSNQEAAVPLKQYLEDWLAGLYAIGCKFGFTLVGCPDHLEVWFGASKQHFTRDTLGYSLRGILPDVRVTAGGLTPPRSRGLISARVVSGIPSRKLDETGKVGKRGDQIEKLCRALNGAHWRYSVFASPRPRIRIIEDINVTTGSMRDVQATHLLKANPVDEADRTALRLVELLDKNLQRYEFGRSTGMWEELVVIMEAESDWNAKCGGMLLQAAFAGRDSSPVPVRLHPCSPSASPAELEPITSAELAIFSCPPLEEYSGYEIVPDVRFGVETNQAIEPDQDVISLGKILDRGQYAGTELTMRRADLTKHGVIVGVTGAGKTNTCFSLLEQVWKDGKDGKGVPFMVIESAKSEYRALLKNSRFEGMRVFTVGDETISPFRLNPFQVPKDILVQSHIDYLQALFGAAFVLYPPMPYVLAMSIQRAYEDKGWDLTRNKNARGEDSPLRFPTLDDLIETIKLVSDGMGYEGEIRSNIKAGLEGRLNQLRIGGGKGIMLNCRESLSDDDLFGKPCLLELKQLVSDEEKAFLIGLLLIRLYEHYESQGHSGDGKLKHVTLIEEAHRLLKNVSTQQGGESANPQGKAIEVFANLLAEIRAFGEGIFMAEQIPTKLAPEALKNTNLKLIHRLVSKDDREAVGETMNLEPNQVAALSTLRAGHAVTFLEGMEKPVLLEILLTKTKSEYEQIDPKGIRDRMAPFWETHQALLRRHPGCGACGMKEGLGGCGKNLAALPQETVLAASRKLRSAFLFYPAAAPAARLDFERACAEPPVVIVGGAYCVWVDLVDRQLTRWAQLLRWPHDKTLAANQALTAAYHAPPPPDGPGLADQVFGVGDGPFVGCALCPRPCHFRPNVFECVEEPAVKLFMELHRKGKTEVDFCADLVGRNLPRMDRKAPAARGHAYCLAVHLLARSGMDAAGQRESAGEIAAKLDLDSNASQDQNRG